MNQGPVYIVKTSPRLNSHSSLLADQIAAGLAAAGQPAEIIDLGGASLLPCIACEGCSDPEMLACIHDDDLTPYYERFVKASGLVIAGPVYYSMVAAQTKLFIDRLFYPMRRKEVSVWRGKPFAAALSFGDADVFTSGAVNAIRMYQDITRYVGMPWAGVVYATEGKEADGAFDQAYAIGQKLAQML